MREADFHRAVGDEQSPLPHPRLAVYRGNVRAALVNALRVRYPQTARALGDHAFLQIAGRFARDSRPTCAVLITYGAAFPAHLERELEGHSPAWLADVARLESAWWQAYHAAEDTPMPSAALAALGAERLLEARLRLHPSLQLVALATAGARRWQALIDGVPFAAADVPEWVMVLRPEAQVEVRVVPQATHDFLAALQAQRTIAAAVQCIGPAFPDFALHGQLAALLSGRIICGVEP